MYIQSYFELCGIKLRRRISIWLDFNSTKYFVYSFVICLHTCYCHCYSWQCINFTMVTCYHHISLNYHCVLYGRGNFQVLFHFSRSGNGQCSMSDFLLLRHTQFGHSKGTMGVFWSWKRFLTWERDLAAVLPQIRMIRYDTSNLTRSLPRPFRGRCLFRGRCGIFVQFRR